MADLERTNELCDEVDELCSRLAELERERDAYKDALEHERLLSRGGSYFDDLQPVGDLGVVEGAAGAALEKMARAYEGVTHPFGFVSRDEAYALARAYRALVADREALLERIKDADSELAAGDWRQAEVTRLHVCLREAYARIKELEQGGHGSAVSRSGGDS